MIINIDYLQENEYYLFYEMMIEALKTDDVVNGLNYSLDLLKIFLNCENVILHKKDESGIYTPYVSQNNSSSIENSITNIVNKASELVEKQGFLKFNFDKIESFKNIILLYLNTQDNEYILSINNIDLTRLINDTFYNKLQNTLLIILKRAEQYEKNTKASMIDLLTGLDNRNSYERRIKELDNNSYLVFGIFDLFRLKYINDNYTHPVGDRYIKETARILKKYWPKENYEMLDNGQKKSFSTGNCIYRVGGDEFILIANNEDLEVTMIKAKLASEEVKLIALGIDEKPIIGLNCGILVHTHEQTIEQTYREADAIMMEDKKIMYLNHNLDRRKK